MNADAIEGSNLQKLDTNRLGVILEHNVPLVDATKKQYWLVLPDSPSDEMGAMTSN